MFPKWIKEVWLSNRKAFAHSVTVWKFMWKLRDKHWSVPDVYVVFFPGQLLSEHWVFSQREATVQVSRVQGSPYTGWVLNGQLYSLMMGWKNLKFHFDLAREEPTLHDKNAHACSSPSALNFVNLKGWNQSGGHLAAPLYFFTCFYSLKILFFFFSCWSLLFSTTHITGIHIFSPVAFASAKPHFKFSVH